MSDNNPDSFNIYLNKIKDVSHDRCWMCGRTPDEIRDQFLTAKSDPERGVEHFELEDIVIMTYKTRVPICASCYFTIKKHPHLIQEILKKSVDEVW